MKFFPMVYSSIHFIYLMYIGTFVDVNNCAKFIKIVIINFFILNTICAAIKVAHISSVLVHVQIKCIPKCSPK
jgi:hypothetical protein